MSRDPFGGDSRDQERWNIGGDLRRAKSPARPARPARPPQPTRTKRPKKKCSAIAAPPRKNNSACRRIIKPHPSPPQGKPTLLDIATAAPPARKPTWIDRIPASDRAEIERLAEEYASGRLPAHINATTLARLVLENRPAVNAAMDTIRIWFQTREREYRAAGAAGGNGGDR